MAATAISKPLTLSAGINNILIAPILCSQGFSEKALLVEVYITSQLATLASKRELARLHGNRSPTTKAIIESVSGQENKYFKMAMNEKMSLFLPVDHKQNARLLLSMQLILYWLGPLLSPDCGDTTCGEQRKILHGKGGRVESVAKFSKRGAGLTGSQFLERAAWKEGVIFFREVGLQFLNK